MKAILTTFLMFFALTAFATESKEGKSLYSSDQTSLENIKTIADVVQKHYEDTDRVTIQDPSKFLVLIDGQRVDTEIKDLPAHKQIEVLTNGDSLVINVMTNIKK